MRMVAGGAFVGLLAGLLIATFGIAVAAWFAIMVAVVAIVAGVIDYVSTHG